ncbi:DUF4232 domain-containing protein [Acidithiobacillus sp. CV18-2]|uniref:DUF4232 domain-containing protein n=1 Tax=Igneacidithiobacillus copahuensis TaxID=2724909 RepID=A0AAE3CL32_9PROT|nr:DUF4232 domain-containing protein [Igneacidithiobacillus copahuensis]MBU2757446.1 DUF4232 domain-containing protein [Acidithiobacillus sp. BN09-2]MBU2777282.1 DUF4232 domain-containing protein [Acidithiobacillus sp. CV18-2]MBU2796235.1 DUF4232 domain-containing protein [Acidithiobacillus sp. VAN18-2]MBU2798436.1 DUF4232 domain-containing protein [Acidithiobacillus sp. VAN18-4]MBU2789155.1 DUF4232 domain-containing protein [Igneacidithiobacillus copahuensis]
MTDADRFYSWRRLLTLPLMILLGACALSSLQDGPPARCQAKQLRAESGMASAGMGHSSRRIYIKNISQRICLLATEVPEIQLLGDGREPIATHQQKYSVPGAAPVKHEEIFLHPGRSASFRIHYATQTGYGNAECPWAEQIMIHLTGVTGPVPLRISLRPYGGFLPDPTCGEISVTSLQRDQGRRPAPPSG